MRILVLGALAWLLVGCAQGPGPDHYSCNQHESREAYEVCMEASEAME